jgi:DNA-binding transcriptional ArsR family regulator
MREGARTTGKDRADELCETFGSNYPVYQYRFVEFFVEHLADVSRVFSGDLQQAMVLAIVGQVRLRAVREARARGEPLSARLQGDATTASRIADVTGIPRETVRRKLEALRRKGWIAQDEEDRLWRLQVDANGVGSVARRDLAGVDSRALARVARLVADLELLDTH